MNNYRYQKSFQFSNKAEDVSSVLSICMKHIQESEELRVVPEDIQSRVKWALTELLINGAKHAGTTETLFHFKLREKYLIIEKEDFGNPLFLKVNGSQRLSWPVAAPFLNQHFDVYENGMDSLRIYTETSNSAFFLVEEIEDVEMPELLINTSEHFGLMIIAKASDHFTYSLDQQTGRNIFRITFNLA